MMAEATVKHDELRDHIQAAVAIILNELGVSEFTPVSGRVLCKPMEKEFVRKEGLIFVVEDDDKRARFNLVVAVASDSEGVQVGDVVITGRYVGHPVDYMAESFRLIPVDDILGVYHDPDD